MRGHSELSLNKPRTPIILLAVSILGVGHMALAQVASPRDPSPFQAVSARSLRANLKFLSSDELKGRDTPSEGLDIAAAWIASQFEQFGLEPANKGSFYQLATFREKPVRNVVGLLRGSDPKLRDTYIILSAHYDHLGVREGEGDVIFNGANDDGSGVVSMLELAKCFSQMKSPPKRSILFMAFWGEEKGLLGSTYYGKNPLFPLKGTVGQINIEQVGRTDDTDGPQISRFAVTGYEFSDLTKSIEEGGKAAGVSVDKRPQGDMYFMASDNAALARFGIPAHTISVAYEFPDYHRVGDHWDKIDYDNLAKITKAIGVSTNILANAEKAPKWNPDNPKVKRYLDAWKKLQEGG